jgi:hypothetical protein
MNFDQFDVGRAGTGLGGEDEPAIFLTGTPKNANHYADVHGANYDDDHPMAADVDHQGAIYPVYVRLERPYHCRMTHYNSTTMAALISKVKASGRYDGITFKRIGYDPESDSICVFDPKQVKSATGNSGRFSKRTPKLTEARQVVQIGRNRVEVVHNPTRDQFLGLLRRTGEVRGLYTSTDLYVWNSFLGDHSQVSKGLFGSSFSEKSNLDGFIAELKPVGDPSRYEQIGPVWFRCDEWLAELQTEQGPFPALLRLLARTRLSESLTPYRYWINVLTGEMVELAPDESHSTYPLTRPNDFRIDPTKYGTPGDDDWDYEQIIYDSYGAWVRVSGDEGQNTFIGNNLNAIRAAMRLYMAKHPETQIINAIVEGDPRGPFWHKTYRFKDAEIDAFIRRGIRPRLTETVEDIHGVRVYRTHGRVPSSGPLGYPRGRDSSGLVSGRSRL